MGGKERSIDMQESKYLNEQDKIIMTQSELEEKIREEAERTADEATWKYRVDNERLEKENKELKDQIEEMKAYLEKAKATEKDYLLLQVRYDQMLRASKELAQCLQYETGNGFIK